MFADPADDPRPDPPTVGDEPATLVGFLRWQRDTLALKCDGLDASELARRSVEPSTLSLLGLLRHKAEVERGWFRRVMAGQEAPPHFYSKEDLDGDFDGAVPDPGGGRGMGHVACRDRFAERFVAEAPDLDVTGRVTDPDRGPMSLRWVVIHMVDEYARHNGHADLLRERIDGAPRPVVGATGSHRIGSRHSVSATVVVSSATRYTESSVDAPPRMAIAVSSKVHVTPSVERAIEGG
jgi:uncharacterized damage-inducible protein DinB